MSMSEYQLNNEYEEDDEEFYFGRFRPIKAKGLPNKRNDRKSQYQYSDWDED